MNGLVLWNDVCGVLVFDTVDAFVQSDVVSNGSTSAIDFDRDLNEGALFGAGDAFFTISVSHCSGFGRGSVVSIGTI
jgi:hypothetical protein